MLTALLLMATHPIVIAHRGASGLRPEHTLAAYELAIEQGADYVEPDCVSTKDGVLICRHENEISGTTDVAKHPEFADRKTTKFVDDTKITGWFSEDFTLAELKTLRCRERLGTLRPENAKYDGQFEIPTLLELLELVARKQKEGHPGLGVYPETKHPSYFASIGLPLELNLVRTLRSVSAFDDAPGKTPAVFIQSFEVGNLKLLKRVGRYPLIQLMDATGTVFDTKQTWASLRTASSLREIAQYAYGIGPDKNLVIPRDASGNLLNPTSLVADAHAAGLRVHPYTFRNEDTFLPKNLKGKPEDEMRRYIAAGIDGFFTDFPGTGRTVVGR